MTRKELVDLAQDLRPIVRTRHAIECFNCSRPIKVAQIYFTNEDEPDGDKPWCHVCACSILLSMYVISIDTFMKIPVYGPLPDWMMSGPPLSWTAPGHLPT